MTLHFKTNVISYTAIKFPFRWYILCVYSIFVIFHHFWDPSCKQHQVLPISDYNGRKIFTICQLGAIYRLTDDLGLLHFLQFLQFCIGSRLPGELIKVLIHYYHLPSELMSHSKWEKCLFLILGALSLIQIFFLNKNEGNLSLFWHISKPLYLY